MEPLKPDASFYTENKVMKAHLRVLWHTGEITEIKFKFACNS